MNIELHNRNRFKEFIQKSLTKLEDLFFSIIQALPDRYITPAMMDWLERYTQNRLNQLQQQTIRQTWKNTALEQAVDQIHARQQDKEKAPED